MKLHPARRFVIAIALVLASASLAWAQTPSKTAPPAHRPKPQHELKLATLAPEGSTWMTIMHELDDAVRAATENRVGFKFYPGGVQGEELVVLKKIRLGQLQGGGFSGQGLGEIASELRVLELPFMFKNVDEIDRVHTALDPTFEQLTEKNGFVILGWTEVGFIYLFTDRPVNGPEDLKQVKMWLWEGDPLATAFFNAYGISPIPLAPTDVLTALQTKLVNGVYTSPLACIALQWNTRVSHMTDVRLTHGMAAVVLDRKAWDPIAPADRDQITTLAHEHFQRLTARTRSENEQSIAEMKKRGLTVVTVDPARVAEFETIGKRVWKEQTGKLYPAPLLAQVEEAVAASRQGKPAPAAATGNPPAKASALSPSGH
ncbi:MAG TPA: TRAP transporter substrate-binding protein DctP [Candidatus Udaeobacter sp.]|nr:TRAP transporter substrate-binding protein DctP [Candidatus Udaeobacter sp.]